MRKVLFLDCDVDDFGVFFRKEREKTAGVTCEKLYKTIPSFLKKMLLFLGLKINKRFLWFLYGDWKKRIAVYDYVIFPSRKSAVFAIEKAAKDTNVIVYYWNLVTKKEINPQVLKKKGIRLCSFDRGDSKLYDMFFADTYYFDCLDIANKEFENKAFYIGIYRPNRETQLSNIKKQLIGCGVEPDFHLMRFNDKKNRMPYERVVENIRKSFCIVDLTRDNQTGLTLRPLESLFFGKKLITNNVNIKNYPFYCSSNIFVLNLDDASKLKDFLATPYVDVDAEIKKQYVFDQWLDRVINNAY